MSSQTANALPPPQAAMLQMISGFWVSRAIYVAAKLGLADHLKEGPRTAAELVALTEAHAPSLYRVMRALASVGVLVEDEQGRFSSTPLLATLQSDVPGSMRAFAMTELGEEHYPAWGELLYSVQTGEIAFDHAFGMPVWEYYAQHPENARIFNDAMSGLSEATTAAVLAAYDFSSINKLVDVGGGHGRLLTAILNANPKMTGVLFDSPSVIEGAQSQIEAAGIGNRCELAAGDFFQSVPSGGDAYILKWIIHDWNDEKSVTILKNCHQAMAEGSKLLLVEAVVPRGSEPHFSKFVDLNMLVMTGGCERTEDEYRKLLASAGFKLTKIIPTASPMSVIEAARA